MFVVVLFVLFVLIIVVVIVYDGISLFYLFVLLVVFGKECDVVVLFVFEFCVCLVECGLFVMMGGFMIIVLYWFDVFDDVDIVIVLFWCDLDEVLFDVLFDVVCVVVVCGVEFVGLCFGVYVFVVVGLFDGCLVIMYWVWVDDFV